MLTNWIVALVATSFLLGFMKPMLTEQVHAFISIATYLVMWFILWIFERKARPIYSNVPYVILVFVVSIAALSFIAIIIPSISEPILFFRALIFLAALIYLFSSTARMYVDVWLGK